MVKTPLRVSLGTSEFEHWMKRILCREHSCDNWLFKSFKINVKWGKPLNWGTMNGDYTVVKVCWIFCCKVSSWFVDWMSNQF
jgi:hypothetical protein